MSIEPFATKYWDWRFRIAFSRADQVDMANAYLKLVDNNSIARAERLKELIDVSSKTLWVGALVYATEEAESLTWTKEAIINASDKELGGLLPEIAPLLKDKVMSFHWLDDPTIAELKGIIDTAAQVKWVNPHREVLEVVFDDLDYLTDLGKKLHGKDYPESEVNWKQFSDYAYSRAEKLFKEKDLYSNLRIDLDQEDDSYGEYWPTTLTGNKEDVLKLSFNEFNNSIRKLELTIQHELAHAVFYDFVETAKPFWFDHGALALVEGWATWVEWQSKLSQGLNKSERQLLRMLDAEGPEVSKAVRAVAKARNYTPEQELFFLNIFTQFPGYKLSYIYGALWYHTNADAKNPVGILDRLSKDAMGDFF